MNKKFPTKFLKQKWRAGNRLWLRIFKLKLLITHILTRQFWIKNCNKISITYLLNTSLCLYCRCWWTKILKRVEAQTQPASKVPKHEGYCTLISLQSWTGNAQSRACVDVLPLDDHLDNISRGFDSKPMTLLESITWYSSRRMRWLTCTVET